VDLRDTPDEVAFRAEARAWIEANLPDDVRGGAFQFYFARPVTREQYLVGKLLPPVLLVFFAAPDKFDSQQALFDRIRNSITFQSS